MSSSLVSLLKNMHVNEDIEIIFDHTFVCYESLHNNSTKNISKLLFIALIVDIILILKDEVQKSIDFAHIRDFISHTSANISSEV